MPAAVLVPGMPVRVAGVPGRVQAVAGGAVEVVMAYDDGREVTDVVPQAMVEVDPKHLENASPRDAAREEHASAVVIQSAYRGRLVRRDLAATKHQRHAIAAGAGVAALAAVKCARGLVLLQHALPQRSDSTSGSGITALHAARGSVGVQLLGAAMTCCKHPAPAASATARSSSSASISRDAGIAALRRAQLPYHGSGIRLLAAALACASRAASPTQRASAVYVRGAGLRLLCGAPRSDANVRPPAIQCLLAASRSPPTGMPRSAPRAPSTPATTAAASHTSAAPFEYVSGAGVKALWFARDTQTTRWLLAAARRPAAPTSADKAQAATRIQAVYRGGAARRSQSGCANPRRHDIIRSERTRGMTEDTAAVEIQRAVRGMFGRRRAAQRRWVASTTAKEEERRDVEAFRGFGEDVGAAEAYLRRRTYSGADIDIGILVTAEPHRHPAAVTIQRVVRGWLSRRRVTHLRGCLHTERRLIIRDEAALCIQCAWRVHRARRRFAHQREQVQEEQLNLYYGCHATVIQAAWRGHAHRRDYRALQAHVGLVGPTLIRIALGMQERMMLRAQHRSLRRNRSTWARSHAAAAAAPMTPPQPLDMPFAELLQTSTSEEPTPMCGVRPPRRATASAGDLSEAVAAVLAADGLSDDDRAHLEAAVVTIQRVERGRASRKESRRMRAQEEEEQRQQEQEHRKATEAEEAAAIAIQRVERGRASRKASKKRRAVAQRQQQQATTAPEEAAAIAIQRTVRGHAARAATRALRAQQLAELDAEDWAYAALTIQRVVRRVAARARLRHRAAVDIQRVVRGRQARRRSSDARRMRDVHEHNAAMDEAAAMDAEAAAVAIQRAARGRLARREAELRRGECRAVSPLAIAARRGRAALVVVVDGDDALPVCLDDDAVDSLNSPLVNVGTHPPSARASPASSPGVAPRRAVAEPEAPRGDSRRTVSQRARHLHDAARPPSPPPPAGPQPDGGAGTSPPRRSSRRASAGTGADAVEAKPAWVPAGVSMHGRGTGGRRASDGAKRSQREQPPRARARGQDGDDDALSPWERLDPGRRVDAGATDGDGYVPIFPRLAARAAGGGGGRGGGSPRQDPAAATPPSQAAQPPKRRVLARRPRPQPQPAPALPQDTTAQHRPPRRPSARGGSALRPHAPVEDAKEKAATTRPVSGVSAPRAPSSGPASTAPPRPLRQTPRPPSAAERGGDRPRPSTKFAFVLNHAKTPYNPSQPAIIYNDDYLLPGAGVAFTDPVDDSDRVGLGRGEGPAAQGADVVQSLLPVLPTSTVGQSVDASTVGNYRAPVAPTPPPASRGARPRRGSRRAVLEQVYGQADPVEMAAVKPPPRRRFPGAGGPKATTAVGGAGQQIMHLVHDWKTLQCRHRQLTTGAAPHAAPTPPAPTGGRDDPRLAAWAEALPYMHTPKRSHSAQTQAQAQSFLPPIV